MYTTDSTLGEKCNIIVRDLRSNQPEPVRQIEVASQKLSKVTSSIWGPLEDTIITGHEFGELAQWDLRKAGNEMTMKTRPHSKQVMDLQRDRESTCFISASKVRKSSESGNFQLLFVIELIF